MNNSRAAFSGSSVRIPLVACLICGSLAAFARGADPEEIGVQVPAGFTVTRYADDTLAHDIFSMTVDSLGRVVVSGPGYVKILIDSDGDGRADQAKTFADGPASGAQGLYFLGRDLLCIGDAGLIRYRDENGDDRADGPAETFLKIKTGDEHHAHAVRRGPDGWWYLIAGNFAEVTPGYATLKNSPVRLPHGGVILRLKPDLSGGEIFCDGLRNAYDFDFDMNGELLTYDSDGERDISLPWYQPTRLFHVVPGSEHGWITESFKRPNYFLDMPGVVIETGRGSPSGVACYRHTQFPEKYRGATFVEDWTFGRVLAVIPRRDGAAVASAEVVEFMKNRGEHGFAPTDIDVGSDGSLFVCVGGRGTHGTVYRVAYTGEGSRPNLPTILTVAADATQDQKLTACLDAPQPYSSWARARWVPLALKLGAQPFLSAALDESLPLPQRLRAVEILTDLFSGVPGTAVEIFGTAKSAELRARVAWSVGVKIPEGFRPEVLIPYLGDVDPLVRRRALESLARQGSNSAGMVGSIAKCLNDDDRAVRLAAARLIPGLSAERFKELAEATRKLGWRATLTTTLGFIWRSHQNEQPYVAYGVDIGRRILETTHPRELKLDAARIMQMAIGDLGGGEKTPGAFEGYTSTQDLSKHERDLDPLRITLAKAFPSGDDRLDLELSRLIAMLSPLNDELLDKVLAKITDDSHPTEDVHYLITAARIQTSPGKAQQEKIAKALINLEPKVAARKLHLDGNWNEHIGAIYGELVARDPELPTRLISDPGFGRPSHVTYMSRINEKQMPDAIAAFMKAIANDPAYPWNNDVVFVIGFGKKPEHLELVRQQYEKFDLRMAALMVLAENAQEIDRERFAAGLELGPVEILTACVGALEKLPAKKDPVEIVALVKLLRRLGNDKTEFTIREAVVRLLERNTGEKFTFEFGNAGYRPQPEATEKWTDYVSKTFPEEASRQFGGSESDISELRARLEKVAWDKGEIEKGQKLFAARGCAQCHGSGMGLGPDLSGVAGRFSREDLFVAIALPSRDVSPQFQTMLVETKAGKTYTGLIVYDSVDGIMLRNGTNQTFRIEGKDIESKRPLPTSLMPAGLLKDLKDEDLADLYTYLKSLAARTAAADEPAKLTDTE
jgi:putative membrane-bound dehydrogenase-like protein